MAELTTIARPYAKAAFLHAIEKQSVDGWASFLNNAAKLNDNEQMQSVINSPSITKEQKCSVYEALLKSDQTSADMLNFLNLLGENHRLTLIPQVAELFNALRAEYEKSVEVNISSAQRLDDDYVKRFSEAMTKKLGKSVTVTVREEPSLIGGAVIQAGDLVVDGSVKGKLNRLAEALL